MWIRSRRFDDCGTKSDLAKGVFVAGDKDQSGSAQSDGVRAVAIFSMVTVIAIVIGIGNARNDSNESGKAKP